MLFSPRISYGLFQILFLIFFYELYFTLFETKTTTTMFRNAYKKGLGDRFCFFTIH